MSQILRDELNFELLDNKRGIELEFYWTNQIYSSEQRIWPILFEFFSTQGHFSKNFDAQ